MEIEEKQAILKALDTKRLQFDLETSIGILSASLTQELAYRRDNADYIGSLTSDCRAVQAIEAELMTKAEGKNAEARKAWVESQRKNPESEISKALALQNKTTFEYESVRTNVELARRKIDALTTVLRLKTAQITFLSGSDKEEEHGRT